MEKETLVMLHGWGQSHEPLIPLGNLLQDVVKPYLMDLPGFGSSEAPKTVWSAFDYADHLANCLDEAGVKKVSLLGHSFGGKVASCFAIRYPDRVNKLVLIASSGILPKRPLRLKIRLFFIRFAGKSIRRFDRLFGTSYYSHWFISRFGSADYKNAGVLRSILVKSVNEDLSDQFSKIKCQTLILWGENDKETPLEIGKRLSALIANSFFYSFSDHGHQLFEDVGSHLLARYIRSFLKEESHE